MPIIIKDHTWEESDKDLFITVPLKGVKAHKVDILTTEDYVKVSYPPYMFECFLFAAVHDEKAAAEIGNGVVVFKFEKHDRALWNRLDNENKDDKAWAREKREQAIQKTQERAEKQKQEKVTRKTELDRFGVKQQMRIEEDEHKRIEDVKQSERQQATEELEKWKEQQHLLAEQEKEKQRLAGIEREKERKEQLKIQEAERKKNEKNKRVNIFAQEAGVAPVRESGKIEIQFTKREFPTPLRESIKPDEDEWLKKQAEARKIAQIEDRDLTEEERNPQWLKEKGDGFFKQGNMLAAINAYSHAIRLDSKMPSLYSNRSACHLKLGNMFKCAEDASKALELLTPPVPQNAASRVKAHIRRGTAYCHLEAYVEGLMDYEAALKIDPTNEQLKADAEKVRAIIQGSGKT